MDSLPPTSLYNVSVMSSFVVGVGLPVQDGLILMDVLEALPLSTSQHHLVSEGKFMAAGQAPLGVQSIEPLKIYQNPMLLLGLHGSHALSRVPLYSLTEAKGMKPLTLLVILELVYYHGGTALATGALIDNFWSRGQWTMSDKGMLNHENMGPGN